jgi:hypothetical protein
MPSSAIRGRAKTLHINYRTSHQIRKQADRLLGPNVSDVDGNVEDRSGTVSVFNGTEPKNTTWPSKDDEALAVGRWLEQRIDEGVQAQNIGIFVRSSVELDRAREAAAHAGLRFHVLDETSQAAQENFQLPPRIWRKVWSFESLP